ncbi:MAG TPA: mevalonate kinase [Kofleriaceae bacterium]|jgi:mevalonate kinase
MSSIGLGKIILLGEHAVVYGYPALAAALDRGVTISAVPHLAGGAFRIDVPAWNVRVLATDDHPVSRAMCAIADALQLGRPAITLTGDAQIPPGAGLGSSAALAVACARAMLVNAKQPIDPAKVIAAASASEDLMHGRASGIDVAFAASGGIGVFRRASGVRPMKGVSLRVLVGSSGTPRSTAAMVEKVATATNSVAEDKRLRELGKLSDTGTNALVGGDHAALGAAMNRAHEILGGLGVSTAQLDALCASARAAGAWGAKLTGAGGGGAVIAIAPRDKEKAVLATWKIAGIDGFVATIGAPGGAA